MSNACKEAFIQRYAFTPNKLKLRDDGKYRSVDMRVAWLDHQDTWKAAQDAAQATIDSLREQLRIIAAQDAAIIEELKS